MKAFTFSHFALTLFFTLTLIFSASASARREENTGFLIAFSFSHSALTLFFTLTLILSASASARREEHTDFLMAFSFLALRTHPVFYTHPVF